MPLVTIAKLHDPTLAQLVRMKLESEDIPVHLGSEGFAVLYGVQSAWSAVQVQVPDHFEARATAIFDALMAAIGEAEGEGEEEAGGS